MFKSLTRARPFPNLNYTIAFVMGVIYAAAWTSNVMASPATHLRVPDSGVGYGECGTKDGEALLHSLSLRKSGTLMITAGDYRFHKNFAFPKGRKILLSPGASLSLDTGITLTFQGPFAASGKRIFKNALPGQGQIRFAKGSVSHVSPLWWGAKGDGQTDDTAPLQAALTSTPSGSTLFIPAPSVEYRISGPLAASTGNVLIRGAGDSSRIRQTTWGKPVFDLLNVDGVTVSDLNLRSTETRQLVHTASIRFDNPTWYSSGVWTNGNRILLKNLRVTGFAVGATFSSWNGKDNQSTRLNNRVTNFTTDTTQFGVSAFGQKNLSIDHVQGSFLPVPESKDPPHLIYISGLLNWNFNALVRDCSATDSPGVPYQFKGCTKSTFKNLKARRCQGLVNLACTRYCLFTGLTDIEDQMTMGTGAIYMAQLGGETNNIFKNIRIEMSTPVRAARFCGAKTLVKNLTILSNHPVTTDNYDITVYEGGVTLEDITIEEKGKAASRAIWLKGNGNILRNLHFRKVRSAVDSTPDSKGNHIEYDPDEIHLTSDAPGILALQGTGDRIKSVSRRKSAK